MKKLLLVILFSIIAVALVAQGTQDNKDNKAENKDKEVEIPLGDITKLHFLAKDSPDIGTRIRAIQELAKYKKRESVDLLIEILEEPFRNVYAQGDKQLQDNWKVRQEAARAIRVYKDDKEVVKKVYMPLTKVMIFDPEERVKGESALTLGIIGKDADPEVKERIADELITRLNHTDVSRNLLALMIVKSLGRLGHPKALVHLIAVTQKGFLRVVKEEAKKSIEMLQNY